MAKLHRPYARQKGAPPSVTTVLGLLDKPGLSWAAANETASFALNHQEEWRDLDGIAAYDRMRKHHRGVWDHRAAMGTLVHSVNEAWTGGETVDLVEEIQRLQSGHHVWASMPTDQVVAEASVMVDGLERAWMDLDPETVSAEDVVRYPEPRNHAYIGQMDWRVYLTYQGERRLWLVDVKTTGKDEEALYWDSWRLQLAAYRGATEVVHYDDSGKESGTSDLPPVDGCAILHVRANGAWALYPVRAAGDELGCFLRLRDVFGWVRACKDCGVEVDITEGPA